MPPKKNWLEKLAKNEYAVVNEYNPYEHVIRSPSPSVNFIFGNTHGIPQGYSAVLFGKPKSGKSLISNAIIGQIHKDDPEGYVIKYDTEMREQGQMTKKQADLWGIDRSRYICFSRNDPELFDHIHDDVAAMCQDGMPLKLIIIDSMNGIRGRRQMNADTIMTQQIGDNALTNKEGLKYILEVQRKYHIALLMTTHVAAEMDPHEQQRGNKVKMASAFGVQHHAEYFVMIEPDNTKAGRQDFLGNDLKDESLKDMQDREERTGHKIRITMKDSSVGPKGRVGQFTLDYHRGIINTHEEVFVLGSNRGVIGRPNNRKYVFEGKEWDGKEAMLTAIKEDPELYASILQELRARDSKGLIGEQTVQEEGASWDSLEKEESAG